jgi:hypothetical protein
MQRQPKKWSAEFDSMRVSPIPTPYELDCLVSLNVVHCTGLNIEQFLQRQFRHRCAPLRIL